MDLEKIVIDLSQRRKSFHSEADFQHELAHDLRVQYSELEYRLEYPRSLLEGVKRPGAIDLAALQYCKPVLCLELKYKTSLLKCEIDGEMFELKKHGASSNGQYDIIKDIEEIERLKNLYPKMKCAMIAITNDSGYWKTHAKDDASYRDFSLHDGRLLHGNLEWRPKGDPMAVQKFFRTQGARAKNLQVRGKYDIQWKLYPGGNGFRYLIIEAN
jgi:hypothetical protein